MSKAIAAVKGTRQQLRTEAFDVLNRASSSLSAGVSFNAGGLVGGAGWITECDDDRAASPAGAEAAPVIGQLPSG